MRATPRGCECKALAFAIEASALLVMLCVTATSPRVGGRGQRSQLLGLISALFASQQPLLLVVDASLHVVDAPMHAAHRTPCALVKHLATVQF